MRISVLYVLLCLVRVNEKKKEEIENLNRPQTTSKHTQRIFSFFKVPLCNDYATN
jgi:hypothetical protein